MPRTLYTNRVELRTGHGSIVETANGTSIPRISVCVILKASSGSSCGRGTGYLRESKVPVAVETKSASCFHCDGNWCIAVEIHINVLSRVLSTNPRYSARTARDGHVIRDTRSIAIWRRQGKVQEIDPQLTNVRVLPLHVDRAPVWDEIGTTGQLELVGHNLLLGLCSNLFRTTQRARHPPTDPYFLISIFFRRWGIESTHTRSTTDETHLLPPR